MNYHLCFGDCQKRDYSNSGTAFLSYSSAFFTPVFRDVNTVQPFVEDYSVLGDDGAAKAAAKPDHIYMDCMGFGMGCCCLQMTFQACNIEEARMLYDQLTTLCPIMVN